MLVVWFFVAEPGKKEAVPEPRELPIASMRYLAATEEGEAPFTDSMTEAEATDSLGTLRGGLSGNSSDLYAGTAAFDVCRQGELVTALTANDELSQAFAAGVGVGDADVEKYVDSLLPVTLRHDVWVTDHTYADGRATPYQAVLQAGTAVLIDAFGVPRARCASGSPLAEAWTGYAPPTFEAEAWPDYDLDNLVAVYRDDELPEEIVIYDEEEEQDLELTFKDPARESHGDLQYEDGVTVPNDMGVTPDEELLREYGFSPDTDGDTRPRGSERFEGFEEGFGSKHEAYTPTTTEETTTESTTTSAAPKVGSCEPGVFNLEGPTETVVTYCDGQWARVGKAQTDYVTYQYWNGSQWDLITSDGETFTGFPCYDTEYWKAQGAPREITDAMIPCDPEDYPDMAHPNCRDDSLYEFGGGEVTVLSCDGNRANIVIYPDTPRRTEFEMYWRSDSEGWAPLAGLEY